MPPMCDGHGLNLCNFIGFFVDTVQYHGVTAKFYGSL